MNDITLGKCPFCGGKVVSAVESRHKGALVAYWCARPVCENGCPVGRVADGWDDLHVGYGGDPGPDVVGTDLAAKWAGVCETLMHPRPCPRCGGRPAFVAANAVLCFGCPDDGLVKSEAGTTLLGLVVRWNGEAAAAESAGRRQAELEEECGILNRAFWPERLKGE